MNTAKLIINGKEYEVQLTDEQVTEIEKPKKITGFERVEEGESYFSIDAIGTIYSRNIYFEELYNNANYYTDESLAEWCNRNDTLNRKMRRWATEHNTYPIDWESSESKWYIYYNCKYEDIEIGENKENCSAERVYYQDYSTAEAACEEFGEEIKWLAENRPKWF